MQIKTTQKIEITITMNEFEARWLKGIMQNPFYGQNPSDEQETDKKNREMFWHTLNENEIR